jgi:hypothetical protein
LLIFGYIYILEFLINLICGAFGAFCVFAKGYIATIDK